MKLKVFSDEEFTPEIQKQVIRAMNNLRDYCEKNHISRKVAIKDMHLMKKMGFFVEE